MRKHTDIELMKILKNKQEYQAQAIDAVLFVMNERNLLNEKRKAEIEKQIEIRKQNEKTKLNPFQIKKGMNMFYLMSLSFYITFFITFFLELDFDEDYIRVPIFLVVSIIIFLIPNFLSDDTLKYIKTDKAVESSKTTIWIAEAYYVEKGFDSKNLNIRRGFISSFVLSPLFIYLIISNGINLLEENDNYRPIEYKSEQQKINKIISDARSQIDSVHIFLDIMKMNTADEQYTNGEYSEALANYKSIKIKENKDDTTLYNNIGQCYLSLKLKDSACFYWQKSIELGALETKKLVKKYCKK